MLLACMNLAAALLNSWTTGPPYTIVRKAVDLEPAWYPVVFSHVLPSASNARGQLCTVCPYHRVPPCFSKLPAMTLQKTLDTSCHFRSSSLPDLLIVSQVTRDWDPSLRIDQTWAESSEGQDPSKNGASRTLLCLGCLKNAVSASQKYPALWYSESLSLILYSSNSGPALTVPASTVEGPYTCTVPLMGT